MNSIRIALATATLALVSSATFASDLHVAQIFGRDSVTAHGKSITPSQSTTGYANIVPGRQGGLSIDAKQGLTEQTRVTADIVSKAGRA